MTTEDLAKLQRKEGGNKLLSIVDVSCDWEVCCKQLLCFVDFFWLTLY